MLCETYRFIFLCQKGRNECLLFLFLWAGAFIASALTAIDRSQLWCPRQKLYSPNHLVTFTGASWGNSTKYRLYRTSWRRCEACSHAYICCRGGVIESRCFFAKSSNPCANEYPLYSPRRSQPPQRAQEELRLLRTAIQEVGGCGGQHSRPFMERTISSVFMGA